MPMIVYMIIGVVLTAVAAMFVFFGFAEKTVYALSLPKWLVFLCCAALISCAFIPIVDIYGYDFSIGTVVMPLVVGIVFAIFFKSDGYRVLIATAVSLCVSLSVRMLIPDVHATAIALTAGFVASLAAYPIAGIHAVAAHFLAMPIAECVAFTVFASIGAGGRIGLGAMFDACLIAVMTTVLVHCVVRAARAYADRKHNSNYEKSFAANNSIDCDGEEYMKYLDD